MRFLASILTTLSFVPFWLRWGLDQSEQQIDKMQESVFNSPGSEAPITPPVILASGAIVGAHMIMGMVLFRLGFWRSVLSFIMSLAAGLALFLLFLQRQN